MMEATFYTGYTDEDYVFVRKLDMGMVPRINESVELSGKIYKIADIIWDIPTIDNPDGSVKIMIIPVDWHCDS